MYHYVFLALILLVIPFGTKLSAKIINQRNYEKVGYWFCIFILMSLGAFRAETVGNDTQEYIRIFGEIAQNPSAETRYEIGYVYLNYIISLFSSNSQYVFIITSGFVFFSFGRFIWKYSKSPWLSIFIFFTYGFFTFSITAVRQSLAIGILLFSYDYILQGKKLKFVLTVLTATMFHATAVFFILSYFCRVVKPTMKTIILFFVIGIFCSYLFSTLLDIAFGLFTMYEHYDGGEYFGETRLASILYVIISLFILLFSYYVLTCKKVRGQLSEWHVKNSNCMLVLVLFAVTIYIISLKLNILDRIAIYYNAFSIILLPNAIFWLNKTNKIIVTLSVILFFLTYSAVIIIFRPEWGTIYPYSFCW